MSGYQTLSEEIDAALLSHVAWKHRLRKAAFAKDTSIPVKEVASDSCCRFGKWLASLDPNDQRKYHFDRVKTLHTEFHNKAGLIAQMLSDGKVETALATLNGADYNLKSKELASALMEWKAHS
ncbi:CZB domain-containing protein [Pseudophaeobacter sp.]|uniref:CZB domain-containing protein n=1 Tax=Pseudophaeobacter sp. TaxID=1971739 RepID=UPI0032981F23